MNGNRNKPGQGPYGNQRFQYRSQSFLEHEAYLRYNSQANLQQMSDNQREERCNDSNQNVSYRQETRFQYRSFCQGRETDSDAEQCYSLNDQRAQANQNQRHRGYRPQRRNYRGNPRNRKTRTSDFSDNRSYSRGYASDVESVPQTQFSNKPPHSDYSADPTFSSQNMTTDWSIRNFDHAPKTKDADNNKSYGKLSEERIGNLQDNTSPEQFSKEAKDTLTELWRSKENFDNILKNLKPTTLIMDCRQKVDELAKDCIVQNLKSIGEIKSKLTSNNCDVLKLHLENLIQQQKQFDNYIAKVKGQLSSVFVSDIHDLLKSIDSIKNSVQSECKIFKRALPVYAFKSNILNKVTDNQVTIITADSTYFLNLMLPVFLKNEFKDKFLVCCEASEVLCARLKRNVFNLLYNKVEMDEIDEKKLSNSIQFMTEKELLNVFLNDYTFDEKNVIVVLNLPLKRSVDMDIVLANLRDMLLNQDKSKLVLLSSIYDHASKYETYFAEQTSVAVINMPSLILPVKTVWKSAALLPTDDYIDEVVKTILAIHTINDNGDVMVFFPILADAKSASVTLTKKLFAIQIDDLECFLLHENSTSKYCLDLFTRKKSPKRTIFLVTDCAEMLLIPSVCFVIDCGLRKEHMFDSSKKLDVLTTTFISRDKCKLRKSLAGAFHSGICYRLYNKENYCKEMLRSEYPEILTVNPFNSMIKVFQHRPTTATTVEFVESLPLSTKENALKLLKKYNAIKDNTLTALGKSIVILPFPAKYSKLILLGIQWGLAYEAVVLVSFFSVKGRVFQYSVDEDSQRVTDAVKLQLIQGDSDTLSYLYIYKKWLENNSSPSWCEKNYINFDTLKSVHLKVNEICQIVGESLKDNISQEFSNIKNNTTSLLEMLFECFQENLCVFTGHYKSGYRVLSSHCIAFLHPSSIICQMEDLPQFIIFDHMISTSRDFLVSITSIPHDFVMKGLKDQTVEFDYSDMFEKSLVQKVIEPVGERMIKQVLLGKKGKKLKMIESHIKKTLSTTSLVIEPVPEKGRVLVYALEDQVDQAVEYVNEILKSQFEDIINSEQTHVLELKRGQIRIPVEVKWLKGATVASVKTGKCDQNSVTIQNNLEDEENPTDQSPCVIQQSINLTWTRRRCNGKGFITFYSFDFMAARKHAMKYIKMLDSEVFVQLNKLEPNQLYITEIPPEAKNIDLEQAFSCLLPGVKFERVELKYVAPFETSQNELQEIKDKIEEYCQNHTDLVDFNIVVPMPKPTATVMKAYVNVPDDEDIAVASVCLSNCTVGNFKLVSKAVYRSIIKCSIKVCGALKSRFCNMLTELQNELEKAFNEKVLFDFEINGISDDIAAIKMLSNRREILQTLQRNVNELLEGEVLSKIFSHKLNKIFCHGGHMWLRTLEKTLNIHIMEDYVKKTLRLYGAEDICYSAKKRILQFLEDTENEAVKCFPLSIEGNNRMLLKAVIVEYGANLEKFVEICELQSAVLDIKSCSLSVHGRRESIERAENFLRKLASGLDASNFSDVLSNEETCPICACPPLNLTYRLELCGHLYCSECIQGLLDQAQFPIQCCADNCEKDIVLDDISKVLGDEPEKIRALLEKAMKSYIEGHQHEIFNCPAPDCSMFFYKQEIVSTNDKINCPLCQNDICIKCNVIFHQGLSCDMYHGSKLDADYSFKVWKKTTAECKICPKCNSAIERNGGCDHMTCRACNSHFCWICVTEFPDGNSVYAHLPFCKQHPIW